MKSVTMKSFPWTSVSRTYTINCGWRNLYRVQIIEIRLRKDKQEQRSNPQLSAVSDECRSKSTASLSTHFSLSKFHYLTFVGQWNKLFFGYVKINLTIMFQPANFKATGFQGWVRTRHVVSRTQSYFSKSRVCWYSSLSQSAESPEQSVLLMPVFFPVEV